MNRSQPTVGYAILLNLHERRCVLVGAGKVAARKITALLEAGALVTVISPEFNPALTELAQDGRIEVRTASYQRGMLAEHKPFLVFAATDSAQVNQQIADDARMLGALVNVVTSDGEGDFSNMAALQRGPLTLAVSTGGASPALSAHLRERLEALIGHEYAALGHLMLEYRSQVRECITSQSERGEFWRKVIGSPALEHLRQDDEAAARQVIENLLAQATREGT